ncbi:MAG: PhzF family phenazine biosynthesis protein [Christensenellales bacterium]|jgi:PhzF family phenazine biosynthesis protein
MQYFVIDAFTDRLFSGNPAGVCLLENWPEAAVMQSIAMENNLSETAFLVRESSGAYGLRWFTPETEIDLCGHATLASAFVLMNEVQAVSGSVEFHTKSGTLTVSQSGDVFTMDFPSRPPVPCEVPPRLEQALGASILEAHASRDLLVLLENEDAVRNLRPDFSLLKQLKDVFAVIVTARGTDCDFVSRFFAPGIGVPEDPVTGSSHSTLIPFWRARLGKKQMIARQLSARGGTLMCEYCGDRVKIGGTAVCYLRGEINL